MKSKLEKKGKKCWEVGADETTLLFLLNNINENYYMYLADSLARPAAKASLNSCSNY